MKFSLPLMNNVLQPSAKTVLVLLGLRTAAVDT